MLMMKQHPVLVYDRYGRSVRCFVILDTFHNNDKQCSAPNCREICYLFLHILSVGMERCDCVIIAMEILETLFIIMITKCQIKLIFLQIVLLTSDRWHISGIYDNYF